MVFSLDSQYSTHGMLTDVSLVVDTGTVTNFHSTQVSMVKLIVLNIIIITSHFFLVILIAMSRHCCWLLELDVQCN